MAPHSQSQSEVWAGMPWQVKALGILGLPTVAAVAFAWVLIVDVRSNQSAVLQQAKQVAESLSEHGRDMQVGQIETMRMLRALCLNGAATERAAQNCEDPWSAKWPRAQQPQEQPATPRRMFDR